MINVVWLTYRPDVPARGYWDQGCLMRLFAGDLGRWPATRELYALADVPEGEGAIVCLPAKAHENYVETLNRDLAALPWVVLVLAEDECGDFDTDALQHANLQVWVQTPWPGRHRVDRALSVGWRWECPEEIRKHRDQWLSKPLPVGFAGQITHSRRQACAAALRQMDGPEVVETAAFGSGVPYPDYIELMVRARVVPCPSGAVCTDSFRVWEALEAGAVPVIDGLSPRVGYPTTYWQTVAPEHPLPVITNWSEFPTLARTLLEDWQWHAARIGAWWTQEKRRLRIDLLRAAEHRGRELADRITVLIPTSPIPDHPSVAHIVETINSVRKFPELAQAEIWITCDGVRPEQADLRNRYFEYVRSLLWLAQHEWSDVVVVVHDEHLHQVEMARRVLRQIDTDFLLYLEHDTPLIGSIPWDGIAAVVESDFDLVRLYHETAIPAEHSYLHRGTVEITGHCYTRTVQWSQRPHLARTAFYRQILDRWFSPSARTFVEDKMHSVAQSSAADMRLAIYTPQGDIRRSYHTDGRAGASKYDDRLVF